MVFVCLILLNVLTRLITNYFFFKLRKFSLNGTELLNERTQAVTINSEISNTKLIDKGVPQGSILGPLLFTIFINDFSSCLSNAFCNIFADDTNDHVQ